MTFVDGTSSTRTFRALQRVGVDESLRRARIQEGNTAELYGNGAVVYLDFGGEGKIIHHYYTSNKTRSLLGEQGGVLIGVCSGHHSKITSPPWSDGTCGRETGYPDEEVAADVSSGHVSRGRVHFEDAVSTGG